MVPCWCSHVLASQTPCDCAAGTAAGTACGSCRRCERRCQCSCEIVRDDDGDAEDMPAPVIVSKKGGMK